MIRNNLLSFWGALPEVPKLLHDYPVFYILKVGLCGKKKKKFVWPAEHGSPELDESNIQ